MPELKNKNIIILSPQSWGKMFISKHHYAIELARRGNKVYFLNPPDQGGESRKSYISVTPSGVEENLWLIHHRLWFPYRWKFHALPLFHQLMRLQVKAILKGIAGPIDIIWSFDLGNLYPFYFFGREAFKIFHPVDEPLNPVAIASAKGASLILSVTQEILDKYEGIPGHKYLINHGLPKEFLAPVDISKPMAVPLRIGLSGNLLRQDIDRAVLLQILQENPEVNFEFLGSFTVAQSNISGEEDIQTLDFIQALKALPNVKLHGPVATGILAKIIHTLDAFLICYDVQKDQSRGTNYHKVIEYLSTGKVVISNNVTAYRGLPELVQMVAEREHNAALPSLFKQVIGRLEYFNSPALQSGRIAFAEENTYERQVERIEKLWSL